MTLDRSRAGGARWLLPALLAMGWSLQAQAQCAGPMNAQQYGDCMMTTVILPQQQLQRQREEDERNRAPPRAPTPDEIERARQAEVARHGWGAYAASPGLAQIGRSADLTSESKAQKQALKDCESRGGKGCTVLATVENQCLVLARNAGGAFALGRAKVDLDAAEQALQACAPKSPEQLCRLHPDMVCSGLSASTRGSGDPAGFARALEARYDRRPLWGAVASDGRELRFVANATSARLAGERALADCGAQCTLLATSRQEDQCLVAAWVPGATAAPRVIESYTPGNARAEALRDCAAATGQACAASPAYCSGRAGAAEEGDGTVRGAMRLQEVRAEDLRESLAVWVGMGTGAFREVWGSPDKIDDGGQLLATRRTLVFDYSIKAGAKRPARPCLVQWSEVDERIESYALKGEGCRLLFK